MRPERAALRLLSTTRAKAKMYEYSVPEEAHIALPQRPELLFSLAVGLLGDAAAAIGANTTDGRREAVQPDVLAFSGTYFDAYLQSRLNNFAHVEFPTLAAASHYLADNPGSAKVLVSHSPAPSGDIGGGLALLAYRLLLNDYTPVGDVTYGAANRLLSQLAAYVNGEEGSDDVPATQGTFALKRTTPVMVVSSYTRTSSRRLCEIKCAIPLGQFSLQIPASRWICGATPFDGLPFLASCGPPNGEFAQPGSCVAGLALSRCRPARARREQQS
jgi:hypothetical protein